MAQNIIKPQFRQSFKVINKELLQWFPGHMGKGLKQMQQKLKLVDCIIEVHDARIPISGRNTDFKYTVTGLKPQILVFNKKDMIDKSDIPKITAHVKKDHEHIIFTNCKNHKDSGVRKILPLVEELILSSERYNRANSQEYNLMVIGIPNVGKSSLINCLRNYHLNKAKASQVGAMPGITRSVLNKIKMSQNPLVYLYDTPGILMPNIKDTEVGLKLGLCATLQDHLVGEIVIADYLLYWLNKQSEFTYVKTFGLEKPTDEIGEILAHISQIKNKTLKIRQSNDYIIKPDFRSAAQYILKSFRDGELGKIMLDRDIIKDE